MTVEPERLPPSVDATIVLALLRITIGVQFVSVFFENLGKGLYTPDGYAGLIDYYVQTGHAPAGWKAVMSFMASHAAVAARVHRPARLDARTDAA